MICSKHGAPMRQEPPVLATDGPQKKAVTLAVCTAMSCMLIAAAVPVITCLIVRENGGWFDARWFRYGGGMGISTMLTALAAAMSAVAVMLKKGKYLAAEKLALVICLICALETIMTPLMRFLSLVIYNERGTEAIWFKYGCASGMAFLFGVVAVVTRIIVAYDIEAIKASKAGAD